MAKDKKLSNSAKSLVSIQTVFKVLFVLLVIIIGYSSKKVYEFKTQEYKNEVFTKVDESIIKRYDTLLKEKVNTSLLASSSLSKNINIKKALALNNANVLDMGDLLEEMKTGEEYANIQAEVIDADGISFKRSWIHFAGDDLVKNDPKMEHLIKYPRVVSDIVATKYGMTISNKIPIYYKERFLGLFGVNIHFDALAQTFMKEGFKSVILLNKEDSKNIFQNISYSKKFVGDCYVVNSNAENYLLKIIKNDLYQFCDSQWENSFKINELTGHLVSRYAIKDESNKVVAHALIFKSIDEIDFQDLGFFQNAHIAATVLLVLLVGFLINYLSILSKIKQLNIKNEELIKVNHDLTKKTDEMDFNDKKLENLFNMQPNLMFMHNGKDVTKVNKRFMGFFNRFGTFDGFKKKHKCVSELFEKYEAPNYVWEQYIEGEFWIDYMLKNPRRLYKTVMSINGDPHHFIIKFNEMHYSKHVTERVIIVALVDMTQDLVNYKTLEESSRILKDININKKLELKEEKQNTDISYEFKTVLEENIKELTAFDIKSTQILKTEISKIDKNDNIMVQGDIKFSDVESKWSFIMPAATSSKLLNMMSGDTKLKVQKTVTKDELDTAKEFISYLSFSFCELINKKKFHDLKNAKYHESSTFELSKEDTERIGQLYSIKLKLSEGSYLEFYMELDNDIAPFFKQLANDEEIMLPGKKDKTIKPQVTLKTKPSSSKLDAYDLIQNSLSSVFKDITSKELGYRKIKEVKNINGEFIHMDKVFKIKNKEQNIDWSLLIPTTSLEDILNSSKTLPNGKLSLQELSEEVKKRLKAKVEQLTSQKVTVMSGEIKSTSGQKTFSAHRLFDLNMVFENKKLPVFIALKNK